MALNLNRGSKGKVTQAQVEQEEDEAELAEAEAAKQREEADAAAAALASQTKNNPEEGATLVPPKPIPPARLRATKYDIVCPHTTVRVTTEGTPKKVPISTWLKAQIDAGLIEYIKDGE